MITDYKKFYEYVFGNLSNIDERIKTSPLAHQAKRKQVLKAEIDSFFSGSFNKPLFRTVLRKFNPKLEEILFGDSTSSLGVEYPFPDDKTIEQRFHFLEKEHHIFGELKESDEILNRFKQFFKVCKVIGDCFECNNDSTNGDTVAFLHAYKMLAVFEDLTAFSKYIDIHKFLQEHGCPIQNTLKEKFPKNISATPLDLKQWRNIILTSGQRALKLFQHAPLIQNKLSRSPKTYQEANEMIKTTIYKGIRPELAELCMRYDVDKETYESCLEVEKNIKSSDNLPNIKIDGDDVNHSGYYLVKLPINDVNAYFLGKITKCCQHMGGNADVCVVDGLTRPNNGFYVLLKAIDSKKNKKQKEMKKEPIVGDKINYADYAIVGQGYAWLSQAGNLTFDSWENAHPERDNDVIVPMLEKFSHLVTEGNSNILRVTIGGGTKIPDIWKDQIRHDDLEKIKEGFQYADSKVQATIYCNATHQQKLFTQIRSILEKQEIKNDQIDSLIQISDIYSVSQANDIVKVLQDTEMVRFLTDSQNITKLSNSITEHGSKPIWEILIQMQENKLLTLANLLALTQDISHLQTMYHALLKLNNANLLDDDNRKEMVLSAENSLNMADALIELKKSHLLTNENRLAIIKGATEASSVCTILQELYTANTNLLNEETRQIIVEKTENTPQIAIIFGILNSAKLLNEANFKSIMANIQYIVPLCDVIQSLKSFNLISQPIFDLVTSHPNNAEKLESALNTANRNGQLYLLKTIKEFSEEKEDKSPRQQALQVIKQYAEAYSLDGVKNYNFSKSSKILQRAWDAFLEIDELRKKYNSDDSKREFNEIYHSCSNIQDFEPALQKLEHSFSSKVAHDPSFFGSRKVVLTSNSPEEFKKPSPN